MHYAEEMYRNKTSHYKRSMDMTCMQPIIVHVSYMLYTLPSRGPWNLPTLKKNSTVI